MAIFNVRGGSGGNMSSRPVRPVKPSIKQPSAQSNRLPSLSQRVGGGMATKNLAWQLKVHKNKIYEKYRITGREVDEKIQQLQKYKTILEPHEAYKMEKESRQTQQYGSSAEKMKNKRWSDILNDSDILGQ